MKVEPSVTLSNYMSFLAIVIPLGNFAGSFVPSCNREFLSHLNRRFKEKMKQIKALEHKNIFLTKIIV